MRTLGLIGGMSWISTRAYYERINKLVQKRAQPMASAPMLIDSLDYSRIASAKQADDWDAIASILVESARKLESGGAEAIVIAANTMHKSYERVSEAISIPVLHIADSVGEAMAEAKCESAALLGTRFVMTESFYRQRLVSHGVDLLPPDPNDVELVDGIIYKELMLGRVTRDAETKEIIADEAWQEGKNWKTRLPDPPQDIEITVTTASMLMMPITTGARRKRVFSTSCISSFRSGFNSSARVRMASPKSRQYCGA